VADQITNILSRLSVGPLRNGAIAAQRAYMRVCRTIQRRRSFVAEAGFRMVGDIADYVPQRVCFFGVWEPVLTSFVQETVVRGQYAVDVGANVGYYTLLMSKLVGEEGRVFSYEANPRAFAILRENLALNSCAANVRARNIAVAGGPGRVRLYDSPFGVRNTGMVTTIAARGATSIGEVACESLVALLGHDIDRVSFAKVDVEGAERPILRDIIEHEDRFATPLVVVAEIDDCNVDLADDFREAGFDCGVIANDYSVGAYLEALRSKGRKAALENLVDREQLRGTAELVAIRR
jgi:FkbM family methyltransferase